LKAVRGVQPRYEAMVKDRLRRDNASTQDLREPTRKLQAAIVNYATKIIGTIERDEPAKPELLLSFARRPIPHPADIANLTRTPR
jgi:hypothetical protein